MPRLGVVNHSFKAIYRFELGKSNSTENSYFLTVPSV